MQLAQNLQEINNSAGLSGTTSDVGELTAKIVPYIYYGAGILLLVYLIMGGYQIMFAKGDPKAISGGWAKVSNALIGFFVIILAYAITKLLGQILGVGIFSELFSTAGGPGR